MMMNRRSYFLLMLLPLFVLVQARAKTINNIIGNYVSHQILNDGLFVETSNGQLKIQFYGPSIARVRATQKDFSVHNSPAVILPAGGATFTVTDRFDRVELQTDSMKIYVSKSRAVIAFFNRAGQMLSCDDPSFAITWHDGEGVTNYRKLFAGEKFYGLGEKTGNLNRKGAVYSNWNTENTAYPLNADPLYKTIPFFMAIHGGLTYGIFFDNSFRTTFDFAASSDEQFYSFSANEGELDYYFLGASSFASILKDYARLTGSMTMPPKWSLGYHQSRASYTPDTQLVYVAKTFRQKNIPADALYIDYASMDGNKPFTWNNKDFSTPSGLIQKLGDLDFHVVATVAPSVKAEKGFSLYDEGVRKSYFAKYPNGQNYVANTWSGKSHLVDFTKEDARKWWGSKFAKYTDEGIQGFVCEMNEPSVWGQSIPSIVEFGIDSLKRSIREIHNLYGLLVSESAYKGVKNITEKRPFVLSRSAYASIQRYAAVYTGDNVTTDDHMLLGQRLITSLGYSGVSFVGVDIGGDIGETDADLTTRWNSLGVYMPLFRNNAAQDSKPREPWVFGEAKEQIIRKDIETRYKLLPYIYSTFYQSKETGMPISRGLPLCFPADDNVYLNEWQNQFMFGDAFLVAPTESTKEQTKVYLPEGGWYRFSNDEYYEGPQVFTVASPLNDLPVFVKGSAIIPMQAVVQSTREDAGGVLLLHLWNGVNNTEYVYYEDDGKSYDAERGGFYKRKMRYDAERRILFVDAVEGLYPSTFTKILLVLHGFKGQIKTLKVNGLNQAIKVDARSNTTSVMIDNVSSKIIVGF